MRQLVMMTVAAAVAALLGSAVAVPAQAANQPVSPAAARQMAADSGLGSGPAKCYQGGASTTDPSFGWVSKTLYGKSNSQCRGTLDAALAIVHKSASTGRWVAVDWNFEPNCASARKQLKKAGASRAVINDIIGDWPC